jgi:hypothetical protein
MTTPDSGRDTSSFEIADQKIGNLLKQLNDKNVCPCCVARALAFHGRIAGHALSRQCRSDPNVRGHRQQ